MYKKGLYRLEIMITYRPHKNSNFIDISMNLSSLYVMVIFLTH